MGKRGICTGHVYLSGYSKRLFLELNNLQVSTCVNLDKLLSSFPEFLLSKFENGDNNAFQSSWEDYMKYICVLYVCVKLLNIVPGDIIHTHLPLPQANVRFIQQMVTGCLPAALL